MKKHFAKITSSLLFTSFLINQVMVNVTFADDSVITNSNESNNESTAINSSKIPVSAWEENTNVMSEVCDKLGITDISEVTYDDIKTIKSLNISLSFQPLPQIIEEFSGLRVLDIVTCNFSSIPDTICNLTNLEELNLTGNTISSLPDSFSNLSNLTFLNLSSNNFDSIPEVLYNLPYLQYLDLSHNNISEIPSDISNIKTLVSLDLTGNKLNSLPDSISQLDSLRYLGLSKNNFYTIPELIFSLTKLEDLTLAENNLIEIPNLIQQMSGDILDFTIDVSQNQIHNLPETTTQNIIAKYNLLPTFSNGIPTGSELILTTDTLNLDLNEEISSDRLKTLVNVHNVLNGNNSTTKPLDSRISLELIIDNKIVTPEELASYNSGIYKAYLKIKGADINNKNAISSKALTINIGNSSDDNNGNENGSLVIPDDATGIIPYEYWENCIPLMIFTCNYLKISDINEVTFEDLATIDYVELINQNISSLPTIITKYSNLKELLLINNKLTSIPKEIFKLKNLERLSLLGNKLSSISDGISQLCNLKYLDLSLNDITYISPNVKNLKNLELLSLSRNINIQSQLETIYTITSLKRLYLDNCNLYTLGGNINKLTNLEHLEVDSNQLILVPSDISYYNLNFIPLENSLCKTLSLKSSDLTLTTNDILSQDTLHNLVNVEFTNWDGSIAVEELNSNHELAFIINNKIVTADELSKYPNGSYKANLIIKDADIDNTASKTTDTVTINITENNPSIPITNPTTNTTQPSNKLPSTGNESTLLFLLSGSLAVGYGRSLTKRKKSIK